jgi:hypothetical protein
VTFPVTATREIEGMATPEPRLARREPRLPRLLLARTLWTLTKAPAGSVMAAIYITDTGRELRVTAGDAAQLLDSLLSRSGDEPLERRAAELRQRLESHGWSPARAGLF